MPGAVVIVVVLLALPSLFLITGGVLCALVGWSLKEHADATHEGSELLDLNY